MFGYPMMMPNGMSVRDIIEFENFLEEREKKKKDKEKDKAKKESWPKWTFSQWLIILFTFGPWVGAIQWTLLKHTFGW